MSGESTWELKEASFVKSSAQPSECPKPDRPEYAFIGRSNVGKSSLLNMLVGRNSLAKTSSTPGKTQLLNHFDVCLLYTSPSPRDGLLSRMPSSA